MEEPRTAQAALSKTHFNGRAPLYDASNGGWHITFGTDYISWLSSFLELRGASILDLACGTGLVTFPAARAVGPTGRVVGVDITPEMLALAREKLTAAMTGPEAEEMASVDLIEGDITDLLNFDSVTNVMRDRGGWDAITVCSAVPLISDLDSAFQHWKSLLKPGGILMFDVPTEDHTIQHLLTMDVPERMNRKLTFDRRWVQGLSSIEDRVTSVGLKVEKGWRTRSYVPEKVWKADQADELWEQSVLRKGATYRNLLGEFLDDERARDVWRKCFRENLNSDGTLVDGHWLYVMVARRNLHSCEQEP